MKGKKILIGAVVGVILGIITIIAIIISGILFFLFGGPPKKTSDVTKYEEYLEMFDNTHSGFITFPDRIPSSAKENAKFYFSYQDTFNFPTSEVYLLCTYSAEDYAKEVTRLEETYKSYGDEKRYLLRDEDKKFNYPAYIAIKDEASAYEYALLVGTNQIAYIFVAAKYSLGSIDKIPEEYLPSDYEERMEEKQFESGYSIYLNPITSSSMCHDYDYSK